MSDIENEVFEREETTNKESLLVSPPAAPTPKKKKKKSKKRPIIVLIIMIIMIVWLLAIGIGLGVGMPEILGHSSQQENNEMVSQKNKTVRLMTVGAVAADHETCSEVGRDILDTGGSAVDAAIASLLCNGIMQPHSMGIGGGCLMVIYDPKTKTVDAIKGREVAPEAATMEKFMNKSHLFGPLSIAVPGEIKSYWAAHEKYGRLPWKDLFVPSIKLATEGAPLSPSAARGLRFLKKGLKRISNTTLSESYPDLCKIYCDENGEILKAGTIIYRKALAETLQGLADEGPAYLYNGEGGKKMIADLDKFGSLLTLDDLRTYEVRETSPLTYTLGDVAMHTLGAPTGGPVFGLILKIIEGFNFTAEDISTPEREADTYHKMVEAFKFAYSERLKLGDPRFVDVKNLMERMVSSEYADFIRSKIDLNTTHNTSYYTNLTTDDWDSHGTTHISIIGPDGDAVAVTSTINYYFGSKLYSPSTGIILNNEMADFTFPSGASLSNLRSLDTNFVAPRKMPMSSMTPAIFINKNDEAVLVIGSSGGARITTVNAQVAARLLWLNQTLQEAIQELRFHHQLFPNNIIFEQNFPVEVRDILSDKYGHRYTERTTYMAVVQGVSRNEKTGEIEAFSDERKHGVASLLQRNVTIEE